MTDLDEHLLLRGTARDVFASDGATNELASLGWLGLLTAEDAGGEGWFPYEATLIAMEGGRAGTQSTWFMSALVAALVSRTPGTSVWAEALLAGEQLGAFAYSPQLIATDGKVTGTAGKVLSEGPPDIVVLYRPRLFDSVAATTDQDGVGIHSDVVTLETERHLYRLTLDRTPGQLIDREVTEPLGLLATVLLCADTIGAVDRAVQIVTQYLSERDAFEVPIASFQVVQHRLVNLATFQSASEALVLSAATALAEGDQNAECLALAAHSYIEGRAVRAIDDCIQLAGGMGFTWEFPVHHALRRVSTNAALFGSGRTSRHRLARAKGRVR